MSRKAKEGDTLVTRTTDEVLDTNTHKKVREDKRNDKLTDDLMYGKNAGKRTVRDTMAERDRHYVQLHTFGGNSTVYMGWDLNEKSIRDQVFMLQVGDQKVYLSAVELQKYLRWV